MPEHCFYTVADSRYFLGVAALINSLRLSGNAEPVTVVDCGFEPHQRELLEREATLIRAPGAARPNYMKWHGPLERPARVMVHLDADVIVLRALQPLVELAAQGKVVAFEDLGPRFFEEWSELVGQPVERRTYLNSGFWAVGGELGPRLLRLLTNAQLRMSEEPVVLSDGSVRRPYKHFDQDVFNAVLGAFLTEDEIVVVERGLAPCQPFPGLRLRDPSTLDVRYVDGTQPYLLHHLYAKPWLKRTPTNPYTRLLPRLLLADDLPIKVPVEEVPFRLRPGLLSGFARDALVLRGFATRARLKARQVLRGG
jgi:hypothetical protein